MTRSSTHAPPAAAAPRRFTARQFDDAYAKVILGNHFFEDPQYYQQHKDRYRRTLAQLVKLPLPRPARILEVGGGQMILLCQELFDDQGVLADVNTRYADAIDGKQLEFVECDLLHDEPGFVSELDAVVMCEVVEHLPVPLHTVLEKVLRWIKPGGYLFLTTPNLYRLRNLFRMATGKKLFCPLFYPARGQSIGHPFELDRENLRWHVERAGFKVESLSLEQLTYGGGTPAARAGRLLASPLLAARPLLRDNMVCWARRPADA